MKYNNNNNNNSIYLLWLASATKRICGNKKTKKHNLPITPWSQTELQHLYDGNINELLKTRTHGAILRKQSRSLSSSTINSNTHCYYYFNNKIIYFYLLFVFTIYIIYFFNKNLIIIPIKNVNNYTMYYYYYYYNSIISNLKYNIQYYYHILIKYRQTQSS